MTESDWYFIDAKLAYLERQQRLDDVWYRDVSKLKKEVQRLQALVISLADRVARQSELLSQRAEKPVDFVSGYDIDLD